MAEEIVIGRFKQVDYKHENTTCVTVKGRLECNTTGMSYIMATIRNGLLFIENIKYDGKYQTRETKLVATNFVIIEEDSQ